MLPMSWIMVGGIPFVGWLGGSTRSGRISKSVNITADLRFWYSRYRGCIYTDIAAYLLLNSYGTLARQLECFWWGELLRTIAFPTPNPKFNQPHLPEVGDLWKPIRFGWTEKRKSQSTCISQDPRRLSSQFRAVEMNCRSSLTSSMVLSHGVKFADSTVLHCFCQPIFWDRHIERLPAFSFHPLSFSVEIPDTFYAFLIVALFRNCTTSRLVKTTTWLPVFWTQCLLWKTSSACKKCLFDSEICLIHVIASREHNSKHLGFCKSSTSRDMTLGLGAIT